jgi:hypothetical protein
VNLRADHACGLGPSTMHFNITACYDGDVLTGINVDLIDPPALSGSDKQIQWAKDIRDSRLKEIHTGSIPNILRHIGLVVTPAQQAYLSAALKLLADSLINDPTVLQIFSTTGADAWINSYNKPLRPY